MQMATAMVQGLYSVQLSNSTIYIRTRFCPCRHKTAAFAQPNPYPKAFKLVNLSKYVRLNNSSGSYNGIKAKLIQGYAATG